MSTREIDLKTVQRVVSACTHPWHALFTTLLETGARYSEIATLTREQVGIDSIRIEPHVLPSGREWRPKRPASVRTLVVGGDLAASLAGMTASREAGVLIFWPERAEPVQSRTANYMLKKHCLRLGVPPFSTHQFRRVRIAQSLQAGGDPNTVRAAVGHRSLLTTIGYLRDVPVRGELPALGAEAVANPAVAQYMSMARSKNWSAA